MFWMLMGGSLLLVLTMAGVVTAMRSGSKPEPPAAGLAAGDPGSGSNRTELPPPVAAGRSDAEFLAEAEPLTRKFLEAVSIAELLPLVRNPGVAEGRMRRHYPGGGIVAPGMAQFNTDSNIARVGAIAWIRIRTRDYEDKALAYVETPQGIKIDWESWAGWSEMPWAEFLASKPTTAQVFRLNLSALDYYNVAFADDRKWQSYRLISPDGEHSLYGYAERDSVLNSLLRPPPDSCGAALMLALKFPENASSSNQVLIVEFVTEGWVLETESTP